MNVIKSTALKHKMVEAIEVDPSKPVKRVYDQTVRLKLNRKVPQLSPLIPHNVNEVLIENEWAEIWSGTDFLCHQDNDWGVQIFGTDENFAN